MGLEARMALQMAEEELSRLLLRLAEIDLRTDDWRAGIRKRYQHGLTEIRAVEADFRRGGDALASRLSAWHLKLAEREQARSEQRQAGLHAVITTLGTALVIAAVVPSLFQEKVKLPRPEPETGLAAMLLIMVGAAMLFWRVLDHLSRRVGQRAGRRLGAGLAAWALAVATSVGGALLIALA